MKNFYQLNQSMIHISCRYFWRPESWGDLIAVMYFTCKYIAVSSSGYSNLPLFSQHDRISGLYYKFPFKTMNHPFVFTFAFLLLFINIFFNRYRNYIFNMKSQPPLLNSSLVLNTLHLFSEGKKDPLITEVLPSL